MVNGLSSRLKTLADYRRIRSIPLAPQAIAHHRRWRGAGLIVLRRKRAAGICGDAEHCEVIAGNELAWIALRCLRAARALDAEKWRKCRKGR